MLKNENFQKSYLSKTTFFFKKHLYQIFINSHMKNTRKKAPKFIDFLKSYM